jgi:hydrogenase nickel incorporation protein HypB
MKPEHEIRASMTNVQSIELREDLRQARRAAADAFRQTMAESGTLVVRLISSPGSGKTSLLAKTVQQLAGRFRVGILVGDVETERDAQRLAPFAPTVQITTGGACHLELPLIEKALPRLASARFDFLFIEDIGNLICPAAHDLGEHLRVLLLSTTEGDDKPGKYPKAFRTSDVVVITKTDLLPHVPFDISSAQQDARRIRADLRFFQASALRDEGVEDWTRFLIQKREQVAL